MPNLSMLDMGDKFRSLEVLLPVQLVVSPPHLEMSCR